MRIELSYIQKCKTVAHVLQALFIFVTTCITIAIFTKGGDTDGRPRWFFALCFLTIPILVYQVMVPMWTRALRFANQYAYFALDALYTIFWFSAFICMFIWTSSGIDKGADEKKVADGEDRNCTHFAYGSETKCNLARAAGGLGVVIFILFGLTTAIATYNLIQYRKGELPAPTTTYHSTNNELEAQKDNTWSSSTQDIDNPFAHEDDDTTSYTRSGRYNHEDDEHTALNSTETEDGRHPGRPTSWGADGPGGLNRQDTEYHRAHTPSALSPDGYEDTSYNSRGRGYSFGNDERR